jgi:hypothetical protein
MRRARMLFVLLVSVSVSLPLAPPALATDPDQHTATPNPRNSNPHSQSTAPGGADVQADSFQGAVISNGLFQLGINPEGNMDVENAGSPSSGSGTTTVGLRYVPTNAEVLAPGCLCEGWGVADSVSGVSGWADKDYGGASASLSVLDFSTGEISPGIGTASSRVQIGSTFIVQHDFLPAPETPDLYQIRVTIQNISSAPATALYRRVMDWDVEPTYFDEFVTIGTIEGGSPYLVDSTDDGFAHPDPLQPATDLGHRGTFTDAGPDDIGALFDFNFGSLQPGEAKQFLLYYGATANEGLAINALSAVGAEVWSIAEPNTPLGPTLGEPNTFIFGFSGGADYCNPGETATINPSGVSGEPQVEVNYPVGFASPRSFVDPAEDSRRVAEEVQARAVSTIQAYSDLDFDMPDQVTIDIVCSIPVPAGFFVGDPDAFVEADSHIYFRADTLRDAFSRDISSLNQGRLAATPPPLPARGLPAATDRTPTALGSPQLRRYCSAGRLSASLDEPEIGADYDAFERS